MRRWQVEVAEGLQGFVLMREMRAQILPRLEDEGS
jgi:hypothetical protein